MLKALKGYRTIIIAALVAVVPAAVDYLAGVPWTALGIDPKVAAALGVVFGVLRIVTTTPIGGERQ